MLSLGIVDHRPSGKVFNIAHLPYSRAIAPHRSSLQPTSVFVGTPNAVSALRVVAVKYRYGLPTLPSPMRSITPSARSSFIAFCPVFSDGIIASCHKSAATRARRVEGDRSALWRYPEFCEDGSLLLFARHRKGCERPGLTGRNLRCTRPRQ